MIQESLIELVSETIRNSPALKLNDLSRYILKALDSDNVRLRSLLEEYAKELCKLYEYHPSCGKLPKEACQGCRARAILIEGLKS